MPTDRRYTCLYPLCSILPLQERVLAGDEVNLVSLRWSWIAMVRPDDAGTPVATWRVILFAKHDTVSASKGRNSLPIDADDTVRQAPLPSSI
jgi:hypothetical protein